MLKITNDHIYLTRGDTARLDIEVDVKNSNGILSTYTCVTGDTLKFSVKQFDTDTSFIFQKVITDFTNGVQVVINPEDTSSLSYDNYIYDVQLTLANGDVNTIIESQKFTLTKEVS